MKGICFELKFTNPINNDNFKNEIDYIVHDLRYNGTYNVEKHEGHYYLDIDLLIDLLLLKEFLSIPITLANGFSIIIDCKCYFDRTSNSLEVRQ